MPEIKTQFVSALPLAESWKLAKCSDKVLPKVLPHIFAKCDRLEGDGGAGTVRVVTLGSGIHPTNSSYNFASLQNISFHHKNCCNSIDSIRVIDATATVIYGDKRHLLTCLHGTTSHLYTLASSH